MPEPLKLYNTKNLTEAHKADSEFIYCMVGLFLETIPKTVARLRKACVEEDWANVYFYAHKLKASIDLFDLVPLQQLIRHVEVKSKSATETETIAKDVDFISSYIKKCIDAMRQDFKQD